MVEINESESITSESSIVENENNILISDDHIHTLLIQGHTYFDILLYNCYNEDKRILYKDKLNQVFDDLIGVYDNLFSFGISLSGYQFVGLILENNLALTKELYVRVAYFILSSGFLISMFGVLICFITIEYLRGCREEHPYFIIAGINKYKLLFKSADVILYIDSILFIIPINLLIYNILDIYFGIIYNCVSFIFFILGIIFHYNVIIAKQQYNIHISNKVNNCNSDIFSFIKKKLCKNSIKYTYQRKLFKRNN